MFEVRLSGQTMKFLEQCDPVLQERLHQKLVSLRLDPTPREAILMKGRQERTFRIRVGDYRILYSVLFKERFVAVTTIDKRGRVYE